MGEKRKQKYEQPKLKEARILIIDEVFNLVIFKDLF